MKLLPILPLLCILFSCAEKSETLTAQSIIDTAIAKSCNGNCKHADIEFTFRNKTYKSSRTEGKYSFERTTNDTDNSYRDVVSNNGFTRFVNDSLVMVADSTALKLSDAVNSVHYFAQLPYGLNAPAVQKELIGEATIKQTDYFIIDVRFSEEDGGTDFEDLFVYWIAKETYTVDYLAYSYAVNGGGVRFREAFNERYIQGIRFVDYNNYKPERLETPLTELPRLFEAGSLKLLSKIETENVHVALKH